MVHFWATICTVALACAGAVQGMALVERSCPNDPSTPTCQTSGGSPLASDCQIALRKINGPCKVDNGGFSKCTTVAEYGSCKVDACGDEWLALLPGINCGGYLQSVLNSCNSGGRVGGQIIPLSCNIDFPSSRSGPLYSYHLQFSHSG